MVDLNQLIAKEKLRAFCQRWRIVRVDLFGSALNEQFSDESDIDLLVTFQKEGTPGFFKFVEMKMELEGLLRRSVDVMTRRSIERSKNPYRRQEILGTAQTIYDEKAA